MQLPHATSNIFMALFNQKVKMRNMGRVVVLIKYQQDL
jgi:hypothetical protein